MIIQKLTMENFRQYYGRQTIEFAKSDGNQIVTVICGENGRGKTGIYRAIMLALFGDVKLDQDAKEADIYLANVKAVEEQNCDGHGAFCSVKLCFTYHGDTHTIERKYFAMKDAAGKQKEQLHEVRLVNETSEEEWRSEKDIREIIQQIVDERVKHYFFFDGERIERLTRVSAQQKQEVTLGIKNLLKIDQVLKSRDVLKKVLSKVNKELEKNSTGDYKKAHREMVNLQERLDKMEHSEEVLEQKKIENNARLAQIDEALSAFDSMKADMKDREVLEMKLGQIEQGIEAKFEQSQRLSKYLPLMVGEDVFQQGLVRLSTELSERLETGITLEFIKGLLTNLRCICGTTIDQDSIEYRKLDSLADSVKRYEENQELYTLKNELNQLVSYLDGRNEQISQVWNETKQLNSQKDHVQYMLEEINKRLGQSREHEVKELSQERKHIVTNNVKIDYEKKNNKDEQEEYLEKIKKCSIELKELEKMSGLHKQLLKKHQLLNQSIELLSNVIKKFEADVMDELELATKQNFFYLLDASGLAILKDVKIARDYTIEVLNNYSQPFLANISQGQRQVLSLSFITALAQVAGGTKALEIPLFMDTPFGRLSDQHQENLIKYLPQICSQWVLLVTDKEFGPSEQNQFLESGAIGRFYELISKEAGVTEIHEVPEYEYKSGVEHYG